jgi:hypothetical protein
MCPYFYKRKTLGTGNSEEGLQTSIRFHKNLKFTTLTGVFLGSTEEELCVSKLGIILSSKWFLA